MPYILQKIEYFSSFFSFFGDFLNNIWYYSGGFDNPKSILTKMTMTIVTVTIWSKNLSLKLCYSVNCLYFCIIRRCLRTPARILHLHPNTEAAIQLQTLSSLSWSLVVIKDFGLSFSAI